MFADLDDELKCRIRNYDVIHSFEHLLSFINPTARTEITEEQRAANPEVLHPLVITRGDGSEYLYLTMGSARQIVGMDEEQSQALLRRLVAHVTQDRYVHRHVWRAATSSSGTTSAPCTARPPTTTIDMCATCTGCGSRAPSISTPQRVATA